MQKINKGKIRFHTKASEKYIDVTFVYESLPQGIHLETNNIFYMRIVYFDRMYDIAKITGRKPADKNNGRF